MSCKQIIKIRISPDLNQKVIDAATKRKKQKSAYVRMQIEKPSLFLSTNLEIVERKIEENLSGIGFKINVKARLLNTYGAIEKDPEIIKILDDFLSEMRLILNLLSESAPVPAPAKESAMQYEQAKKTQLLTFALEQCQYENLVAEAKSVHMSMSRYIRYRLEYPQKYTNYDIRILRTKVHYQVYPVLSNLNQICFKFAESDISNIHLFITQINDLAGEIAILEQEIMQKMEI